MVYRDGDAPFIVQGTIVADRFTVQDTLGAGGSGLVAVTEILQNATVPVIFVTAYPERLLTGERPEPTYLVTKPFESDTLKVTISQALSFSRAEERKQVAV